jgi:transcriptional regulator with XRE-family HTH domain
MNAHERKAAKKIARIMRAARKQAGMNQMDLARKIAISQSALSKFENAHLIPSAPQWFVFCEVMGISADSLTLGYLDHIHPVTLNAAPSGFKLPKRYSEQRGSSVRATLPFVAHFVSHHGEAAFNSLLSAQKIDPDFFVDLNNQLNINFCLDLARESIKAGYLKPGNVTDLTQWVAKPDMHGRLAQAYDAPANGIPLIASLISNAPVYDCNFKYEVQEQSNERIEISITPQEHLRHFQYRDDPALGDFLCQYKKQSLLAFGFRGGRPQLKLKEAECHYHGAQKCVYTLQSS